MVTRNRYDKYHCLKQDSTHGVAYTRPVESPANTSDRGELVAFKSIAGNTKAGSRRT